MSRFFFLLFLLCLLHGASIPNIQFPLCASILVGQLFPNLWKMCVRSVAIPIFRAPRGMRKTGIFFFSPPIPILVSTCSSASSFWVCLHRYIPSCSRTFIFISFSFLFLSGFELSLPSVLFQPEGLTFLSGAPLERGRTGFGETLLLPYTVNRHVFFQGKTGGKRTNNIIRVLIFNNIEHKYFKASSVNLSPIKVHLLGKEKTRTKVIRQNIKEPVTKSPW